MATPMRYANEPQWSSFYRTVTSEPERQPRSWLWWDEIEAPFPPPPEPGSWLANAVQGSLQACRCAHCDVRWVGNGKSPCWCCGKTQVKRY